jgi:hypothetical protein
MSSHIEEPPDHAAACASLVAEVTVLTARLRMLQKDLASVDARIGAVSGALRRLRHDEAPQGPGNGDEHPVAPG